MTDFHPDDLVDRSRDRLVAWQMRVRTGSHDVAEEGDRWFLAALRTIDQGLRWSRFEASFVGGRVTERWQRIRSSLPRRSTRRRIQDTLVREARRSSVDPADPEFQSFAENMATLLDLVLAGSIPLSDVGFTFEEGVTDTPPDDPTDEASP